MNGEQVSDALNLLPDELLEETEKVRSRRRQKKIRLQWMAAAACMVLVFYTGLHMISWNLFLENEKELPLLPVNCEWTGGDRGGGFAGVEAFDSSELVSGNPWGKEAEITTLPVYKNVFFDTYKKHAEAYGGDFNQMESVVRDVAYKLGLDGDNFEVEEKKGGYYLNAYLGGEEDGISIEVGHDLETTIEFDPAVTIPDQYHFAYHSSYEELEQVAKYLKKKYQALLGMEEPKENIDGGDYGYNLKQLYDLYFYEGKGDLEEQIINYNFNHVEFYGDKNKLQMIRISQPDLSQKVGDYPILTAKEATELLLNGECITTVPYKVAKKEYVKKVELEYWTELREEYFMPYYTFYVEVPQEEQENGMKTYGLYYVPAVEEKYISYQGEAHFN